MVKDKKFEVNSPAELAERVTYKNPNSDIHYKKQRGKDPHDERAQLFKLPLGGSWAVNCEDHKDFIRQGVLCIKTGTHGKDPRKRIGRSLVWSLPDGIQAVLWGLPPEPQKQMLLFMLRSFKEALKEMYPGAPAIIAIHCDKARIHFEALLLKYFITRTKRGKLKAEMYAEFKGYKADSSFRTAQIATAVFYRLPDPGFKENNSKLCRLLTTKVLQKMKMVCQSLDAKTASRVAGVALEAHSALRVIRRDFSWDGRDVWNAKTFQTRSKIKKKVKPIKEFIAFMRKGHGLLPRWMGAVYSRMKRIRRRRLKVLLVLAALAKGKMQEHQRSRSIELDKGPEVLDRKRELRIESDLGYSLDSIGHFD